MFLVCTLCFATCPCFSVLFGDFMDVCFSFIALKLAFRSITCPPVSHAFGPTFPAWLWHSPDVPTLPEPAPSSTSVMGFLHFPQNTSKHMLFLLMDWLVSDNWGWKNSHSHEWMKKLPNRPIMISCCFLTAASHFKILFWLVHCVPPQKKSTPEWKYYGLTGTRQMKVAALWTNASNLHSTYNPIQVLSVIQ